MPRKPLKPQILLLVANDKIGGVARPVINLSHALQERGFPVRTAFPNTENFDALRDWCRLQGVDPEAAPAGFEENTPGSNAVLREVTTFVRQGGAPDVVSLHYGANYLPLKDVLAVRLAGRRCVASLYSPFPVTILDSRQVRLTRLAARLCHAVITLSHWSRDQYIQLGIAPRRLHVIAPGMRPPKTLPSQADARAALGLTPDAFVIAAHARLVPEKGVADVIAAVGRLAGANRSSSPIQLIIAGYGPERARLEQLASEQVAPSQVRFLGQVDDPANVYAAANVFALATQAESFGIVFVEAAFHGVPSVATTVNAVPETVLDGKTGLLVPPQDPEAMFVALQRLHNDSSLCRRLGDAARTRAHGEFTEASMADRYLNVLFSSNGR